MSKIDLRNFKDEVVSTESDFFTLPVGDTKIRILTDFVEVKTAWIGEYPNSKPAGIVYEGRVLNANEKVTSAGWAWAVIKTVNKATVDEVKIIKFPMGLIGKIAKLKSDPEYSWEDMPMPFDITIGNTGDGGGRYSVTPARANSEVTEKELATLNKKKPIESIVEAIVNKQTGGVEEKKDTVEYPTEEINPEDVPF